MVPKGSIDVKSNPVNVSKVLIVNSCIKTNFHVMIRIIRPKSWIGEANMISPLSFIGRLVVAEPCNQKFKKLESPKQFEVSSIFPDFCH